MRVYRNDGIYEEVEMRKIVLLIMIMVAAIGVEVSAHTPFTLVSSEKKTINQSDLGKLELTRTAGKIEGANLTFIEKEIRLVIITGPEDDMLSYRIQGVRNPNLVVPAGATLRILFVNVDTDMRHDVRFGHVPGEFPVAPEITTSVGSTKLAGRADGSVLQAEELVIKASD